jgi:hypothetical protein
VRPAISHFREQVSSEPGHETVWAAGETIFFGGEERPKPDAPIVDPDQTTGFGHVGHDC